MSQINTTQYALLGMLTFKPMSGYDLKKAIDRSISFFWSENYGHIYPVLKNLEKEGLVTKQIEHSEGKPSRHVYSITDKGQQLFDKWLAAPARKRIIRLEVLLKLFFGYKSSIENMIEKVEAERQYAEAVLEELAEIEKHIREHESLKDKPPYGLLCLNYGKYYYSAVCKWCDETLVILNKEKNKQ
jgi:PadR family transcriptional regulator AphA